MLATPDDYHDLDDDVVVAWNRSRWEETVVLAALLLAALARAVDGIGLAGAGAVAVLAAWRYGVTRGVAAHAREVVRGGRPAPPAR